MMGKTAFLRPLAIISVIFYGLGGVACADLSSSQGAGNAPFGNLAASGYGNSSEERAVDSLPLDDLVIETADGRSHLFRVELASTPEERARGLMFRRSLAPDAGMIFDYGHETRIAMWMKNTYIPLDMLFIDSEGVIRHIRENAVPHDETPIPSTVPVRAVLELNGGTVARLGISPNDRVAHKIFTPAGTSAEPSE